MERKVFRFVLLTILAILLVLINKPYEEKSNAKAFLLPGLPRPIAEAPVVITSAGQSTDTYIIHDISNQLMIRSFFMPQAVEADLEDVETIVFAVGYSSLGIKYHGINYEEEKRRIERLIEKAKENNMAVLTVVLGGGHAGGNKTEELLRIIGTETDYFIGISRSKHENILLELAEERNIPLTLVGGVNDISGSFASAFR